MTAVGRSFLRGVGFAAWVVGAILAGEFADWLYRRLTGKELF